MHYSDSFEIVLCEGIRGSYLIGGKIVPITHNTVLCIPPKIFHREECIEGTGRLYVLQISLEHLEAYINLKNIWDWDASAFFSDFFQLDCFDETIGFFHDLVKYDDDRLICMQLLLSIFNVFRTTLRKHKSDVDTFNTKNSRDHVIKKIIKFSSEHYKENISISDVANFVSLDKNYFCKYFKSATGITYFNYLNQLKITHAITLLGKGTSVTDCCYECGFESLSYFIQLFKKLTGQTPKQYQKTHL